MHYLDLLFGMAARGPRFFPDGWGDRRICDAADPVALARKRPAMIDVRLGPPRQTLGGLLREGTFESPAEGLPECARTARVKLLLPDGPLHGVALHLAASGDQGFAMRLRFAAPLLARGIGALVLENPFYGARRPKAQLRHAVRSVADMHLMAAATFQEGRALLRWLDEEVGVPSAGVTGFSMGGQLAAMVGASMPFPVAVVPVAPTCSPAAVLRGVLRHVADWAALAAAGESPDAARAALCAHLARFSVESLPPPVFPDAAIVVGTAQDGVVPPAEMQRIADHWQCEIRWIPAGHVSAVLRHQAAMREAIADAFLRLERAERDDLRPRRRHRPTVASAGSAAVARGATTRRARGTDVRRASDRPRRRARGRGPRWRGAPACAGRR